MNNNITEDYCSWDVSYLLKQKGLWILHLIQYYENQQLLQGITHSLAIKWIRENFGIHISVHHWTNQPVGNDTWKDAYQGFVNGDAMDVRIFQKHEEAVEAALLYTLKNLI